MQVCIFHKKLYSTGACGGWLAAIFFFSILLFLIFFKFFRNLFVGVGHAMTCPKNRFLAGRVPYTPLKIRFYPPPKNTFLPTPKFFL
jgi:hypothetical protein